MAEATQLSTREVEMMSTSTHSAPKSVAIEQLVSQAAFFSLFSIPDPASPSRGISLVPFIPQLSTGFIVSEDLHRFEVGMAEVSPLCGFSVKEVMGREHVARVQMQMTLM